MKYLPTVQCWNWNPWLLTPHVLNNLCLLLVFGALIPWIMVKGDRLFPGHLLPIWRDARRFIGFCGVYHGLSVWNTFISIPALLVASGSATALFAVSALVRMWRARLAVAVHLDSLSKGANQ